jgi:hypothetical protein
MEGAEGRDCRRDRFRQVSRQFETSRLSAAMLGVAYELVVPWVDDSRRIDRPAPGSMQRMTSLPGKASVLLGA